MLYGPAVKVTVKESAATPGTICIKDEFDGAIPATACGIRTSVRAMKKAKAVFLNMFFISRPLILVV
jgi:hypothetical protein